MKIRFHRTTLRPGFTLVELMIVVVILGVLAALAVVGYRTYAAKAKVTEAENVLSSVGISQTQYLPHIVNPSPSWCPPLATIGAQKTAWDATCDADFWPVIGSNVGNQTQFSYWATAGGPADSCNAPAAPSGFPATELGGLCSSIYAATGAGAGSAVGVDWWVAAAAGDLNGDGEFGLLYTTSEMFPTLFQYETTR
ncbi:MAG: type IV pilus assembly protein PilA [Bradymonadia bacterium]|jgi:type IV pilus assembly protein PilA